MKRLSAPSMTFHNKVFPVIWLGLFAWVMWSVFTRARSEQTQQFGAFACALMLFVFLKGLWRRRRLRLAEGHAARTLGSEIGFLPERQFTLNPFDLAGELSER